MSALLSSVDFERVRRILRIRMKLLKDRVPPMAFENVGVDTQTSNVPTSQPIKPFIEERLTPGPQPRVSTGFIQTQSMMIYTVKTKAGSGTEEAGAAAALIASHFRAGTHLRDDTYDVKIEEATQMPGMNKGDGFWGVSVYIKFLLHVGVPFPSQEA